MSGIARVRNNGVIFSQTSLDGDLNFVRFSASVRNSGLSARRELTVIAFLTELPARCSLHYVFKSRSLSIFIKITDMSVSRVLFMGRASESVNRYNDC